jgi:hypothetical protein
VASNPGGIEVRFAGRHQVLDPGREYIVGRDPSADLHTPTSSVSRRHAVIKVVDGVWVIEDLGSSQGLFVNGQRTVRRAGAAVPVEEVEDRLGVGPSQEARIHCLDMAEALDLLPPEQRAVVLLVALEDVSYDEAAEILDVPIGTIRSRLSRGRESLRALWRADARVERLRRVK